jgi:kynureninase
VSEGREPAAGRSGTPPDRSAGSPAPARAASSGAGSSSTASLLGWREEFPILDHTVYMVSHSLGAMPRGVWGELRDFGNAWAGRGVRAWHEGWWEMPITVGNLIGRIIGAPPDSVAMIQNVTIAVEVVLSCYDWSERRNTIVTTDVDFPSVLYVLEGMKRRGARLKRVPSRDGFTFEMEELLRAIDEETRLVVISHVLFKSATIVDVLPIVRRAREVVAHVLLDAYQAAGTVSIDVQAFDVDFLTGGSVKWLCGGPGAGYLYVKPSLCDTLEPAFAGWAAHADPFSFDPGPIRYEKGIARFQSGTPHIPCLYSAVSGYRIVKEIGVEAIRRRSLELTARLIARADEYGFTVNSPRDPERRGGTVSVGVPEADRVARTLIDREFIIDYRPGAGIRIGPHFYNSEDEIDAIMKEMRVIVDTGAHREGA